MPVDSFLPKSDPTARPLLALAFFGLLLFPLDAQPGAAQDLTHALTSAEVHCYEDQLSALLGRLRLSGAGHFGTQEDGIPWALLPSPGRSTGSFSGLGLSTANVNNPNILHPQPVPSERQLAFHLDVLPEVLLLDPRRPRIPQATLVREEPATTLVSATSEFRLSLALDTGLAGNLGPTAVINNFLVPDSRGLCNGFLASSAQPGRGVLTFAGSPCGSELSRHDHHVLAILQRMFRVTIEDLDDGCSLCAFHSSHETSLFRGEGPHDYLFNVYPYRHQGAQLGRISGRIIVGWDSVGKLTSGTLEVFPRCTAGQDRRCSDTPIDAFLLLWPPGTAGVRSPPQQLGSVFLHYISAIGAAEPVAVPFATFPSQPAGSE